MPYAAAPWRYRPCRAGRRDDGRRGGRRMRRWWTAVAVGGAAALALAGCGAPAGSTVTSPTTGRRSSRRRQFVPAAGVCHHGSRTSASSAATTRSAAPRRTGPRPCTSARSPARAPSVARPRGPARPACGPRRTECDTAGQPGGGRRLAFRAARPDRRAAVAAGLVRRGPLVPLRRHRDRQHRRQPLSTCAPAASRARCPAAAPLAYRLLQPEAGQGRHRRDGAGLLHRQAPRRVRRRLAGAGHQLRRVHPQPPSGPTRPAGR